MTNIDIDQGPQFTARLNKLDVTKIQSDVLAAYIVAYRTLGIDRDFAIACMAELSHRREIGDEFDFEAFIETELAKMPKVENIDVAKISHALKNNITAFTNTKR